MDELIYRQAAIDAFEDTTFTKNEITRRLIELPYAQPEPSQVARDIADIIENEKDMRVIARSEITDEQAILHLQASGWMQRHDKEMYESGLRAQLADDNDSYDALLESVQPEQRWIPCSGTIDIPHHEVLCCDRYGEELIGWLSYVDDQWLCESDGEMMYDPVAWREKPEPYREEGEK